MSMPSVELSPVSLQVYCNFSPRAAVDAAKRMIWQEVRKHGLNPEEYSRWEHTGAFHWLRQEPQIWDLLTDTAWLGAGQWAEPQIVLRLPSLESDTWATEDGLHIDEPPPWANDRKYKAIIGVALTDQTVVDGCLHVKMDGQLVPVRLPAGAAAIMGPMTPHASALNRGPSPRLSVYFRLLEP